MPCTAGRRRGPGAQRRAPVPVPARPGAEPGPRGRHDPNGRPWARSAPDRSAPVCGITRQPMCGGLRTSPSGIRPRPPTRHLRVIGRMRTGPERSSPADGAEFGGHGVPRPGGAWFRRTWSLRFRAVRFWWGCGAWLCAVCSRWGCGVWLRVVRFRWVRGLWPRAVCCRRPEGPWPRLTSCRWARTSSFHTARHRPRGPEPSRTAGHRPHGPEPSRTTGHGRVGPGARRAGAVGRIHRAGGADASVVRRAGGADASVVRRAGGADMSVARRARGVEVLVVHRARGTENPVHQRIGDSRRTPAARFAADAASLRCGVPRGRVGRAEGEGARDEFRRTCS